MQPNKRRHTGVLVRGLFQVLLEHPDGLPLKVAVQSCLPRVPNAESRRLGEQLLRGCVAPMKAGGRRIMILPASLGYGAQAAGSIPANSTLVFVVDLVSVDG